MKHVLWIGAMLCLLAASACVSGYKQVSKSSDHAKLKFSNGVEGNVSLLAGKGQRYFQVDGESCAEPRQMALLDITSRRAQTRRVPADEPIFILAVGDRFSTRGRASCINFVSVTPENGVTYSLIQRVTGEAADNCTVEIQNVDTGETPEAFEILDSTLCERPFDIRLN